MLKVAPLFTDRCVLPMGKELRVFGEADGPVEVSLRSQDAHLLSRAEAGKRPLPCAAPRRGQRGYPLHAVRPLPG